MPTVSSQYWNDEVETSDYGRDTNGFGELGELSSEVENGPARDPQHRKGQLSMSKRLHVGDGHDAHDRRLFEAADAIGDSGFADGERFSHRAVAPPTVDPEHFDDRAVDGIDLVVAQ